MIFFEAGPAVIKTVRGSFLVFVGMLAFLLAASVGQAAEEEAKGPVVKEVIVVGNTLTKTSDILYHMRTRPGDTLDERVLKEDFNRIWKMGNFADVQIHKEQVDGGVRLRVVVKEKSMIRRILFRGNRQASTRTLEELVASEVGTAFDPGIVNKDVRAIQQWYQDEHYYFTDVSFRSEPFEDGVRLIFEIDERGRVAVRDIIFHGNENIGDNELMKHMATKPSAFFSRGKFDRKIFEQDIERLRLYYQSKGYLDAQVKERPFEITGRTAKSKWRKQQMYIHIDINEGPVYYVGKISFDVKPVGKEQVHDDSQMRAVLETMPGDHYSPITVNKDASAIKSLYGGHGRIFTKVRPNRILPEKGTIVDVVFEVNESKPIVVDDVLVTGLTKTQERVVRREVELYPGEVFDSNKLDETERNLNSLNFFERPINMDVKEGSTPDRAKVVIDLKERRTGQFSMGIGLSSADGVVGSLALKQRNFDHKDHPESLRELLTGQAYVGAGEYFALNLQAGNKMSNYAVDFVNPWVFNRPIRFGTGFFYRDREWDSHNETRSGFYFLLGRNIFGKNWDISAKYSLQNVNINNLNNASNLVQEEEGDNWISRMALTLAYDTRDDIFNPTSGWYGRLTQELAGGPFGGTKDFWRTMGEVNYWHTLYEDKQDRPWVLALRTEGAVSDAYGDETQVPYYERYYAGGIGSLRGFDYHSVSPRDTALDPIGGEAMLTASAEVFFPIVGESVRGSVFYDVGNVWAEFNDWDGEDWRSSTGAGLHVKTPLGPMPIRIYYSHIITEEDNDDTGMLQFTFGAYF